MPLIIFYGQIGTGKSYAGRVLSKMTGMPFYDGDLAIPKGKKLDSNDAVDNFVRNNLIPSIALQLQKNKDMNLIMQKWIIRKSLPHP